MKKITKEYNTKTIQELEKDVQMLQTEISKLTVEQKVKPEKDSNLLFKKKKRVAVALTLINQKKLEVKS